jgi:hypothetical protein
MITGRCEALGELVLARAATGASTRAITAAAAVMSFLFRDIPASRVKIGTVTDPNVDHGARHRVIAGSRHRQRACWPRDPPEDSKDYLATI